MSILSWLIASVNNVHMKRGHKLRAENYYKPKKRTAYEVDNEDDARLEAEASAVVSALEARKAATPEPIFRSERERRAHARAKVRQLRDEQRARARAAAKRERALALRAEARDYWATAEGSKLEAALQEYFG